MPVRQVAARLFPYGCMRCTQVTASRAHGLQVWHTLCVARSGQPACFMNAVPRQDAVRCMQRGERPTSRRCRKPVWTCEVGLHGRVTGTAGTVAPGPGASPRGRKESLFPPETGGAVWRWAEVGILLREDPAGRVFVTRRSGAGACLAGGFLGLADGAHAAFDGHDCLMLGQCPLGGKQLIGRGVGHHAVDDDVRAQQAESFDHEIHIGFPAQGDKAAGEEFIGERGVPADVDVMEFDTLHGQVVDDPDGFEHVFWAFARQAGHEVHTDREPRAGGELDGPDGCAGVVAPVDALQGGVIEGLHTQFKPVFTAWHGGKECGLAFIEAVGAGAYGNAGQPWQGGQRLEESGQPFGWSVGVGKRLQVGHEQIRACRGHEVRPPVIPLGGDVHAGQAQSGARACGVAERAASGGERPVAVWAGGAGVQRNLLHAPAKEPPPVGRE